MGAPARSPQLSPYRRGRFVDGELATRIGSGEVGGKAANLVRMHALLQDLAKDERFAEIELSIPRMVVLTTEFFDLFVNGNGLREKLREDLSDAEVAQAFLKASLPVTMVGDLKALIDEARSPLALRSSSLLEDAMGRPFAGVFSTKMVPNNQLDADLRFRRLSEAIKLVCASTFFRGARFAMRAMGADPDREKMAVVIQEVVGRRHGDRFYPEISGVARSYNFYPQGRARPEDGVVDLALGLGSTIVDGGLCWTYAPAYPRLAPPFASAREMLERTQARFEAVNMGKVEHFDPTHEKEFLVEADLAAAEEDETLSAIASTYDADSDRVTPGMAKRGPRVLDFAPILRLGTLPMNDLVRELLATCERELGAKVEIEFAMTLRSKPGEKARFGFLQVRPMVVSDEEIDVPPQDLEGPRVLAASERALGNGRVEGIRDVVYVRPESFEAKHTRAIVGEIEQINAQLTREERPYALIGFGRWGSSDPWLGIPVAWSQICGARVIVEATLPEMNVELSQGSHFFHNISSFRVAYLQVRHDSARPIAWDRLDALPALAETGHLRHVRLDEPLVVRMDGRSGRAVLESTES